MAQVLYDLQQLLSESDFDTIEAFIVLYNKLQPDEAGQTETTFQFFIENLERRYNRKFYHYHDVLKVNLDNFELQVIEESLDRSHESLLDVPDLIMTNEQQKSPASEGRRNKGKMHSQLVAVNDKENCQMIERSEKMDHADKLTEAIENGTVALRDTARRKELGRHDQFEQGKASSSPLKHIYN